MASEKDVLPLLGARHLQTFLLFLAIVVNYASRLNISVSLVAMTDAKTTNSNFYEFDWNEKQKSYILSSFYWGYTLFHIPGGYAARRFGAKNTILAGTLTSSILTLSIPLLIYWGGWKFYCVVRVIQGVCQGLLFPCVYQHLAKWSPVEERNRLGALSHSGIEGGTIMAMYVTGMVAASNWGWPGIAYVFSGIGMSFSLLWFIFAENSPTEAKFIKSSERSYILSTAENVDDGLKKKKAPVPWKAMLTSIPMLSLTVARICDSWGYVTMQAQIPAYLHGVLKMDITNNAFFSTLPYLTMWVFSYIFMIAADVILKYKWTSLLVVRKTVNTFAMWAPALLLIGICFLNENQQTLAIVFITLNVGFNGGHTIGALMNQIDLSPNHAGVIMGFINTLVNVVAIVCPLAVGIIVHDETSVQQWQTVFIITAATFFLGNLQYLFFAQAKHNLGMKRILNQSDYKYTNC